MLPTLDLGPLTLNTFGLALAVAFLCSGYLFRRRLEELGRPGDWAYEALLAAVAGGIVGAHLDWLVQNWEEASTDLLANVFSGTGLVFFGGLLGGGIGVVLWAQWRGFLGYELFDAGAPAVAIGYAVGRLGCQLAGDGDYGIPSDLPWAMAYPNGTVPTTVEVHPTPVYEFLVMGAVTVVLWRMRKALGPGELFSLYLVLGGTERFLIEFIRRNEELAGGFSLPQFIAVAMVLGGGAWLVRGRRVRPPAGARA